MFLFSLMSSKFQTICFSQSHTLKCDQGFAFAPKPGFKNTPHLSLDVPIHFDAKKNDQEALYTGQKDYRFFSF
jgi:hypothetical protein